MRASATLAVLCALAAAPLWSAGTADAQRITVVRGTETGTAAAPRRSAGVTVERGDIPAPEAPAAETAYLLPPPDWRIVAGRAVWLYNARAQLLIGCRLVGTGMTGPYNKKVRCTAPRLVPELLPGLYY